MKKVRELSNSIRADVILYEFRHWGGPRWREGRKKILDGYLITDIHHRELWRYYIPGCNWKQRDAFEKAIPYVTEEK